MYRSKMWVQDNVPGESGKLKNIPDYAENVGMKVPCVDWF